MEHLNQVSSVRWSSDDRWLATFCENGQVRAWDAGTGDPISQSCYAGDTATEVGFVGGRKGLVCWPGSGAGVYWELRRELVDTEDLNVWAALISSQEDFGVSGGRWVTVSKQKEGWERMKRAGFPERFASRAGGK